MNTEIKGSIDINEFCEIAHINIVRVIKEIQVNWKRYGYIKHPMQKELATLGEENCIRFLQKAPSDIISGNDSIWRDAKENVFRHVFLMGGKYKPIDQWHSREYKLKFNSDKFFTRTALYDEEPEYEERSHKKVFANVDEKMEDLKRELEAWEAVKFLEEKGYDFE